MKHGPGRTVERVRPVSGMKTYLAIVAATAAFSGGCSSNTAPAATTAPAADLYEHRTDGPRETLEDIAIWIAYGAEYISEQQDRAAVGADIEQSAKTVNVDRINISAWNETTGRVVVSYDAGGAGAIACVEIIGGKAAATWCDSVPVAGTPK